MRLRILKLRDHQTISEIDNKSLRIAENVEKLPAYSEAGIVACYVNKGSEVQTKTLIQKCLSLGKKVLVPVVEWGTRELLFSEITSLSELAPSHFGISEPDPALTRPTALNKAQLVFIPGIAWDLQGYRLGWGRGYFDTALTRLSDGAVSVGLAFELQVVHKVPRDQFDLPVDLLVTESRTVQCHE